MDWKLTLNLASSEEKPITERIIRRTIFFKLYLRIENVFKLKNRKNSRIKLRNDVVFKKSGWNEYDS